MEMYVPDYAAILQAISSTSEAVEGAPHVEVPASLFKFLLQIAVAQADFNEEGYLAANPDIAAAVRAGTLDSARLHYIRFGFFEGRKGATPAVDERWYLRTYPDVEAGVRTGRVSSAAEHFAVAGASEGRSPASRYESDAAHWKAALGIGRQ
jgi:hypothetical protein